MLISQCHFDGPSEAHGQSAGRPKVHGPRGHCPPAPTPSSVRRILKRGGARNFRKFERNIDQNLKLSHSNFVPFFAQNQVKSKKKGLHSNFVPFFAQNQVKKKKRSSLKFRPIFCPKSGEEQKKIFFHQAQRLNYAHYEINNYTVTQF